MNEGCVQCNSGCCDANEAISAVLSLSEVERLKSVLEKEYAFTEEFCIYENKIKGYRMLANSRKKCILLDENSQCMAYSHRPLDCKLFPLEYRWFRWKLSYFCPTRNSFNIKCLKRQLKSHSRKERVELKLLHLRSPESGNDKLWIIFLKIFPVAWIFEMYLRLLKKI